MKDERKTKAQLIEELREARRQIATIESTQQGDADLRAQRDTLRNSEALLAEAQRIARLGNWEWDIVNDELYWSDEIYRIFGLTPRAFDATYEAFLAAVHPDDRKGVESAVNEAVHERKPYSIDHRVVLPDGSQRVVHEQAEVFHDDDGRPVRMAGTVQDITGRREAEQALKESERRLVEESTAVASIVSNMLGGELDDAETERQVMEACLGCTESVYGMIGVINDPGRYDVTAYSSRTMQDCAFPEALAWDMSRGMSIRGIWGWPMAHGKALRCNDLSTHPNRVGYPVGHVPIDCFLGVPLKHEGKVVGMVAVANKKGGYTEADVATMTRLSAIMMVARQHREALAQAKMTSAELEASNRELEAFAYSVSHDLRAPLRGIDGFSRALVEDYSGRLDDTGKDYLDRVSGAARRMGRLIDDMLQLSRLARSEMRHETLDLSAMAETIARELRQGEPEREVEVVIASDLSARADATLVEAALGNLLGNAWKFTAGKRPARIELGVEMTDDGEAFFVRDNGAGFDMAYVDKLFVAFQRLHGSAEFPGAGIGLAIVQRVIRRHGGRVWARGMVDRGATFYFTLPQ